MIFGRSFSTASTCQTASIVLMHHGLAYLQTKKYRKALSLLVLAGLAAQRFLKGKDHLLGSEIVSRDTVEAELAALIVSEKTFWITFFGMGLGMPFTAMQEVADECAASSYLSGDSHSLSLPLHERNATGKTLLFGRAERPASVEENLARSFHHIVATARLARAVHAFGGQMPQFSPRTQVTSSDSLLPLVHVARAEILQLLHGQSRLQLAAPHLQFL
jgi:hypothetical protein